MIISSFDLRNSLTMILKQVTQELGVDAADVLMLNSTNLFWNTAPGSVSAPRQLRKQACGLGQNYAGRVALERQLIQIPNLKDQPDD